MNIDNVFLYLIHNRRMIATFILVGAITFILNYFFVWLFYGVLVLDYKMAVTLAFVIAAATHFILNRRFTYQAHVISPMIHHAWKYGVMLIINYVINLSVSVITVEVCGLNPYFGVLFAAIIMLCSGFLLMRYFVFFS